MPFVDCQSISVRFGAVAALRDLTLAIEPGAWTYLTGPSGSGKTTLLRAIAGLQPLDSGSIHLEGRLATNARVVLAPHERGVGMLFQEPSLWPHLSAEANVRLALARRPRAERATLARQWLDRAGVGRLAARLPGELSGGEARRVALARALASQPRLLLLDEPTAHLDLHLRAGMMKLLRDLQRELELPALCVTHQIEPPIAPGDRVVVVEEGRAIFDGAFAELAAAPSTPFLDALKQSAARLMDETR